MNPIRLIIADDHKIFRDGLRSLLQAEQGLEVVGDAANGAEVMVLLEKVSADLILMDIDMGESSGVEATQLIQSLYPATKVLVLSMHSDINYIVRMLDVGATGYILKNTGKEEMLSAIHTVANGDSYYSNVVSAKLLDQLHSRKKLNAPVAQHEIPITTRELEVLRLIAEEYSNPEIAEQLFISIRTVDTHRRNLIEKLGLKNTAGLVKYAIKKGIIEPGN